MTTPSWFIADSNCNSIAAKEKIQKREDDLTHLQQATRIIAINPCGPHAHRIAGAQVFPAWDREVLRAELETDDGTLHWAASPAMHTVLGDVSDLPHCTARCTSSEMLISCT